MTKEALKLALEALITQILKAFPLLDSELDEEKHHCEWTLQQDRKRLHAMIYTAQPEPQPLTDEQIIKVAKATKSAEPGVEGYILPELDRLFQMEHAKYLVRQDRDYRAVKTYHEGKPVYVSQPEQAEQPEQEPVAWMYTSQWKGDERFITRYQSELTTYKADKVWPLYTRPPVAQQEQEPVVFARRWKLAVDGFGLQQDDDNGNYVDIDDALSVLHRFASMQSDLTERDRKSYQKGHNDGVAHHKQAVKEALATDYRAVKTYHEGKPVYVSQPEQEQSGFFSRAAMRAHSDCPDHTTPPQRPWVELTDAEAQLIYDMGRTPSGMMEMVEAKLKEKNT